MIDKGFRWLRALNRVGDPYPNSVWSKRVGVSLLFLFAVVEVVFPELSVWVMRVCVTGGR